MDFSLNNAPLALVLFGLAIFGAVYLFQLLWTLGLKIFYSLRPAKLKDFHPQVETTQGYTVDEKLFDLLNLSWNRGWDTTCSCQGDEITGHNHAHPGWITFTDREPALALFKAFLAAGYLPAIETDGCHPGFTVICEAKAWLEPSLLDAMPTR